MPKLSDEERCMLDMMEITGFPMEIKHGLYTYNLDSLAEAEGCVRMYSNRYQSHERSTSDFAKICTLFEKWKKDINAQN